MMVRKPNMLSMSFGWRWRSVARREIVSGGANSAIAAMIADSIEETSWRKSLSTYIVASGLRLCQHLALAEDGILEI